MISNPFPRPTTENSYLPIEVTEYSKLSCDEKVEFCIMMLIKESNPDWLYTFNYFSQNLDCEYYVTPAGDCEGASFIQLTLETFLHVYDNYQFVKMQSSYENGYMSEPLSLLEICEFLYSTTRKGAIDNMLEII